jgi:hypothetical protein
MALKSDERACPKCAETIKKAATVCKHCGSTLAAELAKDEGSANNAMPKWLIVVMVLLVLSVLGKIIGPSDDFTKKYPRGGLTEEQYLEIAADCAKNPDALRCK